MKKRCFLVLENGSVMAGYSFGSLPPSVLDLQKINLINSAGEVVFNTGMTGYCEILTDPSYTGQLVMMTYPHIGNYGVDLDWSEVGPESEKRKTVKPSGLIVKSYYRGPVPAGRETLDKFLADNGVCGIEGIDTRNLTLTLRDGGSKRSIIVSGSGDKLQADELKIVMDAFYKVPSMAGCNLIGGVGASDCLVEPVLAGAVTEFVPLCGEQYSIALLDCGIKANIIREFMARGCNVTVLPSNTSADEILLGGYDAILFSNGPGDPEPLAKQIEVAKALLGKIPMFGICLGHQIISLALGAKTSKMKFGHHGVNHPVRDEFTKRVFITSQNHGFVVEEESLPDGVVVWFRNANDHSLGGIVHQKLPVMSVQFHPEASPGPVDSSWIFDAYIDRIRQFQSENKSN